MAFGKHRRSKERDTGEQSERPDFDDFNYNDTFDSVTAGLPGTETEDRAEDTAGSMEEIPEENLSDTPEVALTKLERERRAKMEQFREEESARQKKKHRKEKTHRERSRRSDLQEDQERANERARDRAATALPPGVRLFLTFLVCIAFGLVIGCMALSQFFNLEILNAPGNIVATLLTPVQSAVSWVADTFSDYLYDVKLRANIETEYSKVVAENEELTYKAMLADELQIQLSQFETIYDEISVNTSMNPIVCTVIGRSDGNYFSSFTINRGSRDGIEQYMAVTSDGALIGYTETVNATSSTVRTIIDSEASIAGLIQSSRDQGTIRGTLGTDGQALCRMYYLPDDSLPRPGDLVVTSGVGMSFPKGIPIGKVRESTRGMESNKSYVVVNPTADFEHIEYVVVLRYQPAVQSIQASSNVSAYIEFVPADTARPYPTLRIGSASFYSSTPTPVPENYVSPTPSPTATVTPEPTATPVPTPESTEDVIEYQVVATGPTPTPVPTPVPTATPYVTIDPASLTLEEE